MTKKQEQTIERLRNTITDLENEMERRHDIAYQVQQHLDTLLTERLELVKKATPIKPIKNILGTGKYLITYTHECSKCGNYLEVSNKYCSECGTELNWNEEK